MGNAHKSSNESGSSDEWQSIQLNVTVSCMFWNICLWKLWILFNVLNVLSQLHEDMLPINVTIAYWFHFYCCVPLHYPILYDDETLINIYNKVGFLFITSRSGALRKLIIWGDLHASDLDFSDVKTFILDYDALW